MLKRILPRLPLFGASPRLTSPILPITRLASRSGPLSLRLPFLYRPDIRAFARSAPRLASSPPPSSTASHDSKDIPPPKPSLSQRLKDLIKSYGWYALGMYIVISTLDFTVTFAAVNLIGAEQVARATTAVKDAVAKQIYSRPPEPGREELEDAAGRESREGLYAMLVLTYAIHKTVFLPVRVGLTAVLTPRLVHWLRARGWAGGQGTKRAAQEIKERMSRRRDHA